MRQMMPRVKADRGVCPRWEPYEPPSYPPDAGVAYTRQAAPLERLVEREVETDGPLLSPREVDPDVRPTVLV